MIKKIVLATITYIFFSLAFLKTAWGAELVAGVSGQIINASPSSTIDQPRFDLRELKLRKFLEDKNSLLVNHVDIIMTTADKYKVDYRLFASISGVESGFCKAYIVANNNCVGWGGGYIPFKSIDDQITVIAKALRENYINDGLLTVDQIGRRWAEDPTWSFKVKNNMSAIEETSIL